MRQRLSSEVRRIIAARALRGFADGFVSVLLASYLVSLGFSPLQVGVVVTSTLIGSAVLTLLVGLLGGHLPTRTLLLGAGLLMVATGVGFLAISSFVPLVLIAAIGTLNPSSGDVSVFQPTEQAFLAGHAEGVERAHLYARYNVAGAVAGALGALLTAAWNERTGFVLYVGVALVNLAISAGLPSERPVRVLSRPLERSRSTVIRLAALFSLDSAGSGLVVTSLLVLWLHLKFDLSTESTGALFFASGLLAALSQPLAPVLARRIGLVPTMVFTHLPANAFLVLAAFAPNAPAAAGLLLARSLLSQMDVPARQAFVMSVVLPEERAAASSVTNVPRSLASAATPALAGWLLANGHLGAPLIIAGTVKAVYDIALLVAFRAVDIDDAPVPAS